MVAGQESSVVVFFGLTASGKSFLSEAWAELRGFPRFNTDVIRKALACEDPNPPSGLGIDKGIYCPEFSRKTYERVAAQAENALRDEGSCCVILDGSYQLASERRRVVERFAGRAVVYFVYCSCSETVTRRRLARRRLDPSAVSDGTLEVFLSQRKKFESPTEIPPDRLLELDTDAPLEYLIDRLERFVSGFVSERLTEKKRTATH